MCGALALFDEISTWGFFAADRTRRPGVSVSLSATRLGAGSPVLGQGLDDVCQIARALDLTLLFAGLPASSSQRRCRRAVRL